MTSHIKNSFNDNYRILQSFDMYNLCLPLTSAFMKDYLKRSISTIFKTKKSFLLGTIYFFSISIIIFVVSISITNYLRFLPALVWSSKYLIDPEKVFNLLTENKQINSIMERILF